MTTMDDLYSTLLHTERTKIDDPDIGYTGGYQQARETRAIFYMRFVQMESTTFWSELVASVPERKHCSPSPGWRTSTGDDHGLVRKRRGALGQRVRRHAHAHYQVCSCAPEVCCSSMQVCSPHISRG